MAGREYVDWRASYFQMLARVARDVQPCSSAVPATGNLSRYLVTSRCSLARGKDRTTFFFSAWYRRTSKPLPVETSGHIALHSTHDLIQPRWHHHGKKGPRLVSGMGVESRIIGCLSFSGHAVWENNMLALMI